MELNEKTSLYSLLKEYPFLLDFLVGLSPAFEKLKNPILRKTVARLATLKQVSEEGKIPLDELIARIEGEIKEKGQGGRAESEAAAALQPSGPARIEVLKEIIRRLHRGEPVEELKKQFANLLKDVGADEIARLEQQVIDEGIPEEEVKKLCDLHLKIFEETLEVQKTPEVPPGHPVHTLMAENRALEKLIAEIRLLLERIPRETAGVEVESNLEELEQLLARLADIEKHYIKKENQLFPLLEARGVTGPTKVMWAIHDDIRKELKDLRQQLGQKIQGAEMASRLAVRTGQVLQMMEDMVYKEEKILFPMSLEVLREEDWVRVKRGEEEIGYAWVQPGTGWKPAVEVAGEFPGGSHSGYGHPAGAGQGGSEPAAAAAEVSGQRPGRVQTLLDLRTGRMSAEQIDLMLTHLPVDISFVDENDTVIYYSDTPDRIFPRSPGVIGRRVQNCHPPGSVHIVNRILEAFRKGERDVAEFWIERRGRFIHIRYFAVRDDDGRYRGCLEVSQDVTSIKALQGEKRLLDWE
ncbi:MAG: DUF438 domain-containing protein [Candidatus Saccharicenans sp.]|nr:DUF438 domain-containing protein [Candidatus Saccharicenans sp.]